MDCKAFEVTEVIVPPPTTSTAVAPPASITPLIIGSIVILGLIGIVIKKSRK